MEAAWSINFLFSRLPDHCKMKKNKMVGITLVWAYVIFTLIVLLYTWSCANVVCKAFNILPVLPWAAFKETYVREHLYAYVILLQPALQVLSLFVFIYIYRRVSKWVD